jgi:hypothetical protein
MYNERTKEIVDAVLNLKNVLPKPKDCKCKVLRKWWSFIIFLSENIGLVF